MTSPQDLLSRYERADQTGLLVTRRLADIEPEAVTWLWPGRLPAGKLVLIEGDPGLGKSTVTADVAARVTTGAPWPGSTESRPAADVLLLSAEDGAADTIRPRFDAALGDPERAVIVDGVLGEDGQRFISLPEDITALYAEVQHTSAALVVIDPLAAFLSGEVNSHRDQDIRRALAPLAQLADETGACVLVVRHLNKGSGPAIYRGGGSIGIAGAARAVMLVAQDPEQEGRRVLAGVKSNLAILPPSLTFTVEDCEGVGRVQWGEESSMTAGQLLAAQVDDGEERGALDEASDLLRELLVDGPRPAKDVWREAKNAGIAKRTYDRARTRLGIRSTPSGFGGTRMLTLPEPPTSSVFATPPQSSPTHRDGEHRGTLANTGMAGDPLDDPDGFHADGDRKLSAHLRDRIIGRPDLDREALLAGIPFRHMKGRAEIMVDQLLAELRQPVVAS